MTRKTRTNRAAIGSVLFAAGQPGVVAFLVPFWITGGWEGPGAPLPLVVVGWALLAAGIGALAHTIMRFVAEGVGTPFPAAPTEHLVVGGLYRYVRNPMYLAVGAVILGQAAVLGRWVLVVYAIAFGATVWSFVHWYEEPTLRDTYGGEYEEYRRSVPGWWPRRPR